MLIASWSLCSRRLQMLLRCCIAPGWRIWLEGCCIACLLSRIRFVGQAHAWRARIRKSKLVVL